MTTSYQNLQQAEDYIEIDVSAISRTIDPDTEHRGDPKWDERLENMMQDIKLNGLLHPPTVELISGTEHLPEKDRRYRLIVGHRRYEAVKRAGYKTIRCLLLPGLTSDQKELNAFSENIHRRDYTKMERAKVIRRMLEHFEGDRLALATALGYTSSLVVDKWLTPLALDPAVAEVFINSTLEPNVQEKRMAMLAKLPKVLQKETAELLIEKNANDADARKWIHAIKESQSDPPRDVVERFLKAPRTISLMVSLTEPLNNALEKASSDYRLIKARIAERAIEEFLTKNGYFPAETKQL